MKLRLTVLAALLLLCLHTNAIIVDPSIRLPKDSTESLRLMTALDSFLVNSQKQTDDNKYVFAAERIETFILLDEITDMEKSGKFRDEHFYKLYLTNVTLLRDSNYLVKVAYIGTAENTPMLRACFELIAHRNRTGFSFSSPLKRNTKRWKTINIAGAIFHFKDSINKAKLNEYLSAIRKYDKKLGQKDKVIEMYCCEDAVELQRVMGVDYKRDYNSQTEKTFSSYFGNKQLVATARRNGSFDFDPHDLWHARLAIAKIAPATNRPVDEGCAYLYGGSWGISWQDIYKRFKEKVAANSSTDWLAAKEQALNFSDNEQQPLLADYVVNALIVNKLEKEKGFKAVADLLGCGKYEAGNANYYQKLESLTGITKENYNKEVWALIDGYKL